MSKIEKALTRWLIALNARGTLELLELAASDQITVERFGFGTQRGQVRERITGLDAVSKWMALTPEGTVFSLASAAAPNGGQWQVDYKLEILDFKGGGKWTLEIDSSGLIAFLAHQPDEIEDGADEWEGDWVQWLKDNPGKRRQ